MDLSDRFRDCLDEAMKKSDLDFEETVVEALEIHTVVFGGPVEVEDEADGVDFLNKAYAYVVEATLGNMVQNGLIEMAGVDETGDIVYKLAVDAEIV